MNQKDPSLVLFSTVYMFLKILYCITCVICITVLSRYFDSKALMWWYLMPLLAYLAI